MPRKRTRAAVDKYLGGLKKDPTSASFRKLRANLGRLVRASPTLPASKKAIEEAIGDPDTVSYLLRVQRYDHINRFLKEVEWETQFPNRCAQVQRPRKSDVPLPPVVFATREVADRHLEIIRQDDNLSVSTLDNYRRALYRFADVAPTLPPDADEIEDQIRVALGDPEEYATATRRQRYIALGRLFKSKLGRELGLADLLNDIPIPPKGKPRIVVLTAEEVDALVNAVETDQERALVYLLLHTGIRIGEVEGMNVAHIVNGELTVDGKTGPRPVTLQPVMERILRELANADGDIWWDDDGALSVGKLEYRYHKIAKRAGIPHEGPHALRHTFATMWLRKGGGLVQLQKMLGHKDLATTQIYEHLVNIDVSQAQAQYAPTATMGIFGPSTIIWGNEARGDTVSGNGDAGNVAGFPLFMTPAAILKIRADRDREARVEVMVKYLEQAPCEEIPGGHPKIELPWEVAQLIQADLDIGHTKSAVHRKYGPICGFSRTFLIDVIADGRLREMAKKPPETP